MLEVGFDLIERVDVFVTFTGPVTQRAERDLSAIPDILLVERQLVVAARLTAGHRSYRTVITGRLANAELNVLQDRDPGELPALAARDELLVAA